jgi:hypothetical protein
VEICKDLHLEHGGNVRSLCRASSLKTIARVLWKYKLDLMGIQDIRCEKGSTEWAVDYTFFYGEGNGDNQCGSVGSSNTYIPCFPSSRK